MLGKAAYAFQQMLPRCHCCLSVTQCTQTRSGSSCRSLLEVASTASLCVCVLPISAGMELEEYEVKMVPPSDIWIEVEAGLSFKWCVYNCVGLLLLSSLHKLHPSGLAML